MNKSITQNNQNDNQISKSIRRFFTRFHLSSALKAANAYKKKGTSATLIFQYLFLLIFSNRSMYMNLLIGKDTPDFAKDTVYRFMKMLQINWIRFTTIISSRIIKEAIVPLDSENRANVLIIDDSMFERNRSKKVELLAKAYDHAKHCYKLGFRMLTLGWSDGSAFLPLKKAGIPAKYVLFDSWFSSPSSLHSVKETGYDVIAMVKKTPKMFFRYNDEDVPLTTIYNKNKKRRGRSRHLLCHGRCCQGWKNHPYQSSLCP